MSREEKVRVKIPKYNIPVLQVEHVLLSVDILLQHEELVTERLNDIMRNMESLNAVDMPIIVAPIPGSDKYLIVDGHHRWAALKELGYKKIPSVLIDYFDPKVKVYTWYPAFLGDVSPLIEGLQELRVDVQHCNLGIDSLSEADLAGKAFIMFGRGGECTIIEGDVEVQRRVIRMLDVLAVNGLIRLAWYGLLTDASEDLMKGEIDYVLARKAYSKAEIMDYVSKGGVYPPKTTRHVLPFIPAKNYVKLEILRDP